MSSLLNMSHLHLGKKVKVSMRIGNPCILDSLVIRGKWNDVIATSEIKNILDCHGVGSSCQGDDIMEQ